MQEHKQIKDGNIGIEGKPIEFEWNIFPSAMFSFSEFHNSQHLCLEKWVTGFSDLSTICVAMESHFFFR